MTSVSHSTSFRDFAVEFITSRNSGFGHDRSKTVGASEIGQCARRVGMGKQGVKHDAGYFDDPGFAERGNVIENHYSAPLMRAWATAEGGKLLWSGQAEQQSIVAENVYASATPDGLFVKMPTNALKEWGVKKHKPHFLLELKSIDPRVPDKNLPREYHPKQVNYGLGLVRAATDYDVEHGLLSYFNASNLTVVPSQVVTFDPELFKAQLRRAKKIITTPWHKLTAEGRLKGGKDCKTCPFQARCAKGK